MAAARGAGFSPLPVVGVPRPCSSRSRRLQQRARRDAAAIKLANNAAQALNILHTPSINMQTRNSSYIPADTLRASAHVHTCARRYVSRLAPSYGGALSDGSNIYTQDTSDLHTAAYAFTTDSLPLSAEKVSLPAAPGSVDLADILPPAIAARYIHPNPDLFVPDEDRARAPFAKLVRSPDDYDQIVRRLHDLDMVTFTTTPKIVNGLFGTPKSDGSQRMVFDGRPANAAFVAPPKFALPNPDLLSRLMAEPGDTIYVAKADLDNYYHRIRLPEWMQPYMALPAVRAGAVGQGAAYGADTMIHPCCTTLPMGWSHSAYLSQVAHEHLIDTRTGLKAEDRVTVANDFKLDRPRHLVYIDDLCIIGPARCVKAMGSLLDGYIEAMSAARLPPKAKKTVLPSADGVECIGVEVHGKELTVGVHPAKVDKLVRRTLAVLSQDTCSGLCMAQLMGHWTWVAMARRCFFAVFNAVYRFIETAGKRIFDIWPTVRRELLMATDLAPLLFSSLRAPWFPRVLATDASEYGQGVVAADCARDHQDRMSLVAPPPTTDEPVNRSLHPTLEGVRWRVIVASAWRFAEHINALELRALTTGLRWALSSPHSVGSRLLVWCDSLVVVYAVRKGRSSSHDLLRRLRVLSAFLLATGVQVYCNWIPTEVNPADGPSRRYKFDSTLGFPGEGPRRDFLVKAAHSGATQKRYDDAVALFVEWMDSHGEDPGTVVEFDGVLAEFFHDLYITRGGACRSIAECTLAGILVILPSLKGHMGRSRLSLKGWRRLVPSQPHPPLTWDLAACIAVRMLCTGRSELGVATLLAFDCYLRVGELVGLRRCDVTDRGDARTGLAYAGMALRLLHTKTGRNQWVEVRSPVVLFLLRQRLCCIGRRREARLFPVVAATYRRHFKAACAALGLSEEYTPHSLRHGGATHDHLTKRLTLEGILRHGRWASTKSARHYIQAGRALLLETTVPEHVVKLAQVLVPNMLEAFALSQ